MFKPYTAFKNAPLNNTFLKWFFVKLSNWRFHFLNDDPVRLIPTSPGISIRVVWNATTSNAETNSYFASSNPATVAFYVTGSVNVDATALVQGSINGGGICALSTVESEVPPFTAACTACNANVAHVNHTKVWITPQFDKIAFLQQYKTSAKINKWPQAQL